MASLIKKQKQKQKPHYTKNTQTHTHKHTTLNIDEGETSGLEAFESEVNGSTVAGTGRSRLWRNRRRHDQSLPRSELSSEEEGACTQVAPARIKNRRNEFLLQQEISCEAAVQTLATGDRPQAKTPGGDDDDRTAVALKEQVLQDVSAILNVSTKSKHLKGTFQKALKEAATSIKVAVEALHTRTASDENLKLQADNSRMHKEVADLRKEMAVLREQIAQLEIAPSREVPEVPLQTVASTAELSQSIMLQVGDMLNARLEELENRLPQRAIDRSCTFAEAVSKPGKGQETTRQTGVSSNETGGKKKGKEKAQRPKKGDYRPPSPAPTPKESEWVVVTKKGKKKNNTPQAAAPGQKSKKGDRGAPAEKAGKSKSDRPMPVKLRPPRSSAVVITLQPEAEKQGITFAKVLAQARAGIDLPSLNITSLKFRTAATGARILEVPGACSGDKADSLAEKLRETLGEGVATVSRPVKCAEMRITGLDDSVTPEDVAVAVARDGGCPREGIKVGIIRPTPRGVCSVWVRAPVAAVRKIGNVGRLLIGWVSARVEVLQPKTLRCYRCLQGGHVRAHCTAEADRSEECYRCGKPGHKANACTATPKCSLLLPLPLLLILLLLRRLLLLPHRP
ncbi:uncharacterized protein [Epargyreus clarus]|uniref:uncharacterized protein n=1 Tax=Epargyreus clarus TaxID=520877 RepID=UPI003C2F9342